MNYYSNRIHPYLSTKCFEAHHFTNTKHKTQKPVENPPVTQKLKKREGTRGKNMSLEIENILKEDLIEKTVDSCYFKGVLKAETVVNIQTHI